MKVINAKNQVIAEIKEPSELQNIIDIENQHGNKGNPNLKIDGNDLKSFFKKVVVDKCDQVQERILDSLLGEKNTEGQLTRYKQKYAAAKKGKFKKEKRELVIQKHEAFIATTDYLVEMMEEARELLNALIDSEDYEKVEAFIKLSDTFTIETTLEDIQKALK